MPRGSILVALLALLAGHPAAAAPEASAPGTLRELKSVEQFSALFQQEQGRPRLVLLLSPT
ncbi:MAG TPA: hypothetical protein VJ085_05085 [Candidatus Acidoferrales bacterium]|nr:hypothetical protein [Candidatus Acidoferrales bacterium]